MAGGDTGLKTQKVRAFRKNNQHRELTRRGPGFQKKYEITFLKNRGRGPTLDFQI